MALRTFYSDAFDLGPFATALVESICTAEIIYRDAAGNAILTHDIGPVSPGCTIEAKVPEAKDFSITIG